MRRAELEERLKALGWGSTGQASGVRHALWSHPSKRFKLAVPNEDLVIDAVAERILRDAER